MFLRKNKYNRTHYTMRKSRFWVYLIMGVLMIYAIIQIFPLIWLLFFSLKNEKEIFGDNIIGFPWNFVWQNYLQAFKGGKIGIYFLNSVIVTFSTVLISGFFASMASYAIARMKWKYNRRVFNLFLIGMMMPLHASLLPLLLILKKLGIYNTLWALIIPYSAFAFPMAILVFTGFLHSLPKEFEEASLLDGCNIYRTFFRIVLPLMKPAIATISIFTFVSTWNELMFAVTFINKQEYKTLTVGIMSMVGQYSTNWGPIGAGLVFATLPTLLIYMLMSNQVQKSFTSGAVKG
jgi:raffinose/stachyose/melibiose transport system permease protein